MEFEWDEYNRDKNKTVHGVDQYEAEALFFNSPLVVFQDIVHSQKEDRYIAFGMTDEGRYLMAVFTKRNEKTRIISARDQNEEERKYYQSHFHQHE